MTVGARPGPAVVQLMGLVMLVRFVPAILWLKVRRRLRGLWTRLRAVPPLALALLLAACAGAQSGQTTAQAHPGAAVAYEAAVVAWTWLDGQNAGQFIAVADAVRESVAARRDEFVEQCGEARVSDCQLAQWESIVRDWMAESGYSDRTLRLERARAALDIVRETLEAPPGADIAGATKRAAAALDLLLQELQADGIKIPEPVMAAPGLLRRIQ